MKSLVLGGTKSGKSRFAESLATNSDKAVTVIATARADDAEIALRIQKHQADRDKTWHVVEEPVELSQAIREAPQEHAILVDCLTLWITNLLLLSDELVLENQIEQFLDTVAQSTQTLIFVSNETSMGIVPMGALSRRYCDEVGLLHQKLAGQCDEVMLIVAGLHQQLKP